MKRNNKKILYESIMKDVSKTIKKRLNEDTASPYDSHNKICRILDNIIKDFKTEGVYDDILEIFATYLTDNMYDETGSGYEEAKYLGELFIDQIISDIQ